MEFQTQRQGSENGEVPEIYVGNLPTDISEVEIITIFSTFSAQKVRKFHLGVKCFAFIEVPTEKHISMAVSQLNGAMYRGRKLNVGKSIKPSLEKNKQVNHFSTKKQKSSLPEKTKGTEFIKESIPPTKDKSPSCENAIFIKNCRKIFYAVPMEMRSLMLMSILNECFGNLNWFSSIMKDEGEIAVMVTETYPESPFFWAIKLSEVSHNKMVTLFTAIAKAEKNQPYLGKDDVQRGKKCLAEFLCTPQDAGAWNRACILEVVSFFALVFFVDFGSTAFIPIYSLKFLSEEEFWQIPPLAQPFMLEEDVFCKERLVKTVLRGKIVGSHMCEHHIHRFVPCS